MPSGEDRFTSPSHTSIASAVNSSIVTMALFSGGVISGEYGWRTKTPEFETKEKWYIRQR
eukprot:1195968-Prorocentrum_minimum.AAC.4